MNVYLTKSLCDEHGAISCGGVQFRVSFPDMRAGDTILSFMRGGVNYKLATKPFIQSELWINITNIYIKLYYYRY